MKRAAFFDVDGTLIHCVTQNELTKILLKEHIIGRWRAAEIGGWFLLYKLGMISNTAPLRKKAYGMFSGVAHKQILEMFEKVWRHCVKDRIREEMKGVVESHRARGDFLFAISGSIRDLCAPVCAVFHIPHLYATDLAVENGRFTGLWTGAILESKAKAGLVRQLAREFDLDLSRSSAYADSYSDVPLLQSVGNPVAVDPDLRLRIKAKISGWKIM